MANKRKYEWFVKPLDDFTNQAVTELLLKTGDVDEVLELKDGHSKTHRVLRVDYGVVQLVQRSQKHQPLRFKVFNRQGPDSAAREWKFSENGNGRKKSAKIRDVVNRINLAKKKKK